MPKSQQQSPQGLLYFKDHNTEKTYCSLVPVSFQSEFVYFSLNFSVWKLFVCLFWLVWVLVFCTIILFNTYGRSKTSENRYFSVQTFWKQRTQSFIDIWNLNKHVHQTSSGKIWQIWPNIYKIQTKTNNISFIILFYFCSFSKFKNIVSVFNEPKCLFKSSFR